MPVIQGPAGVTFSPGTASISYYVGRYDLLVLAKGEKRGKKGMESYVRDNYFAVTKADGAGQLWGAEADGDSTVRTDEKACSGYRYPPLGKNPKSCSSIFPSVFIWVRQPLSQALPLIQKPVRPEPRNG